MAEWVSGGEGDGFGIKVTKITWKDVDVVESTPFTDVIYG